MHWDSSWVGHINHLTLHSPGSSLGRKTKWEKGYFHTEITMITPRTYNGGKENKGRTKIKGKENFNSNLSSNEINIIIINKRLASN